MNSNDHQILLFSEQFRCYCHGFVVLRLEPDGGNVDNKIERRYSHSYRVFFESLQELGYCR